MSLSSKRDGDVVVGWTYSPVRLRTQYAPHVKTAQLKDTGNAEYLLAGWGTRACPACHLTHPVALPLFACLDQ